MYSNKSYSFAGLPTKKSQHDNASYTDVFSANSNQQLDRQQWKPSKPAILDASCKIEYDNSINTKAIDEVLYKLFSHTINNRYVKITIDNIAEEFNEVTPIKIGVVLSGGQAPGGHNVITGLYDYITGLNPQSKLIGFLGGPHGLFTHNYMELTYEYINNFRNMGGFHMIRSGRHKIETEKQMNDCKNICETLELNGLVIIGGDDSNTNGGILAEYFAKHNCATKVIGAPKTIDGDLRNEFIEASFGFDTAVKTYSEQVGNLCVDAKNSRNKFHFIRLMGRSASHIAFECALQTRPNMVLIGEEIQAKHSTLHDIICEITDMIIERAKLGKYYGVILIPEGIVEFIQELGSLITGINKILGDGSGVFEINKLSTDLQNIFNSIPENIQVELLRERDNHGNVQVSKIPTEKLIISMVIEELSKRNYNKPFNPIAHFFGYEGRCAMPTNFDANYCYSLGYTAGILIRNKLNGYMAVVRKLDKPCEEWEPAGCPIVNMMNIELRKGKQVPVIEKYLLDLNSNNFRNFIKVRDIWKIKDFYRITGPVQLSGPSADFSNFTIISPPAEYFLPKIEVDKQNIRTNESYLSPIEKQRIQYRPELNYMLSNPKAKFNLSNISQFNDQITENIIAHAYPFQTSHHGNRTCTVEIKDSNINNISDPYRIGIIFAETPVAGCVNILVGLLERLELNQGMLIAFKGVQGLLEQKYVTLNNENLNFYINQTKLPFELDQYPIKIDLCTTDNLKKIKTTCQSLELNGLVLVGGSATISSAAVLTEYLLGEDVTTSIICVPASSENNLNSSLIETTIGFDTVCKVYSSLIGNLLLDANSAAKYWYFIQLDGNSSSKTILECAMQTHINCSLIGEQISQYNLNIKTIITDIADVIIERIESGKNFGAILVSDGIVNALPEIKALISEINMLKIKITNIDEANEMKYAITRIDESSKYVKILRPWNLAFLRTLPEFFRSSLVSTISLEEIEISTLPINQLLAYWATEELARRNEKNSTNIQFSPICLTLGYQGRSSLPSNFDCALGLIHGFSAGMLVESKKTGFMTNVRGLCAPTTDWRLMPIPLTALAVPMPDSKIIYDNMKMPIIPPCEIDVKSKTYKLYLNSYTNWMNADIYCNPSPIQFTGQFSKVCTICLHNEYFKYTKMLNEFMQLVDVIVDKCGYGVKEETLYTAICTIKGLKQIINDNESQQ